LQFALLRASALGLIGGFDLWHSIASLLGASAAMLAIAFYPLSPRRMLAASVAFFGLTFVAGGAGFAVGTYLARGAGFNGLAGSVVACAVILLVAEFGWGAVQSAIERRLYQVPLLIEINGRSVRLDGLIDTGNQLRDPLGGEPVVIVGAAAVRGAFGEAFDELLEALAASPHDFSQVFAYASPEWARRIRVVPFVAIGRQNGLLLGFRPDAIAVGVEGRLVPSRPCIVAVSVDDLGQKGDYQALVPPALVMAAEAVAKAGPIKKGENVHVGADA
ncbi:MAG TPA: sigma-E processing peptidase SpoIIGA, partial [Limnochordia bacterium]|nr:sigma-E processing peptidase SpoIIGA [Limnochordia bacterium]